MTNRITWQRTITHECSGDIELLPRVTPAQVRNALDAGLYSEDRLGRITVYRDRYETEHIAYITAIETKYNDESDGGFVIEEDKADCEKVIDELAVLYPGTVDYHTENCELFQLLDKDDHVIATIDERDMLAVWNAVE